MKRLAGIVLSLAVPVHVGANPVASEVAVSSPVVLQAGTVIPLVLRQQLSTKINAKGDLFEMSVAEDVRVNDRIVIPAGTRAVGELTRCEPKGAFGRSGKIEARALYVVFGDRALRTTGAISARGKGAPAETVLTTIAAGTLAFVVTGRSATIETGTPLETMLDREVAF